MAEDGVSSEPISADNREIIREFAPLPGVLLHEHPGFIENSAQFVTTRSRELSGERFPVQFPAATRIASGPTQTVGGVLRGNRPAADLLV